MSSTRAAPADPTGLGGDLDAVAAMSNSRMDERTVRDLEKAFARVIEHLGRIDGARAERRRKKKQRPPAANGAASPPPPTAEEPPEPDPGDLLREVLPIALYFLDMRPLVSLPPAAAAPPVGLLPLRVDHDALSPPRRCAMRRVSLDLLAALVAHFERAELFPLWMIFLPRCSHNPYELSLMDKLLSPELDAAMQARLVSVLGSFVDKIGSYFRFVERPSASLGFTPLYQSLGESLGHAHHVMAEYIAATHDSSGVTGATRALVSLLKACPYRKLGFEPLKAVLHLSDVLLSRDNPVIKIAGLNLHLTVLLVASDGGGSVIEPSEGCRVHIDLSAPSQRVNDNNVRYVALQNLGHLASKKISWLASSVEPLTKMVSANLKDTDNAIILHTLRICKWIAKHDPSRSEEDSNVSNGDSTSFMPLWNLLLRHRSFQSVDRRRDATLEALVCDVISELSEGVFSALTQEQRVLCVSYVLCRCREEASASGAQVRSSAFRALGMLLCFKGLRDDVSFLSDCTEAICHVLEGGAKNKGGKSDHRSMVTSATWALASLSEALLAIKHGEEDFPRVHVLRLLTILADNYKSMTSGGNVIAQVNLLRCAGALVQCLDEEFFGQDEEANSEVLSALDNVLQFVGSNVVGAEMMKVQWNACHAAGKIFQNAFILSKPQVRRWQRGTLESLVATMEASPNYKVKISSAVALAAVNDVDDLAGGDVGDEIYVSAVTTVFRLLESTDNGEAAADDGADDGLETKHRLDLADNLVLLLSHLLLLARDRPRLLSAADALLSRDQVDNFRYVVGQVRRRVSPEKERLLSEASSLTLAAASERKALAQLFSEEDNGDL